MPNYFPGGVQIGPPGPQGPPGPSGADPLTTEGDMIYQAGGMAARLPIGIESDILVSSGTDPGWQPAGNVAVASLDGIQGAVVLSATGIVTITDNTPSAGDIQIAVNWAAAEVVSGSGTSWTLAHTPKATPLIVVMVASFGGVTLLPSQTPGFTISGKNVTTTTSYSSGALFAYYPY